MMASQIARIGKKGAMRHSFIMKHHKIHDKNHPYMNPFSFELGSTDPLLAKFADGGNKKKVPYIQATKLWADRTDVVSSDWTKILSQNDFSILYHPCKPQYPNLSLVSNLIYCNPFAK